MPFDDSQEQEGETTRLPFRPSAPYQDPGQASADDDQFARFAVPIATDAINQQLWMTDALQRRLGAPPQTATAPSIGQRILALGQSRSPFDVDASGTLAEPKRIGRRIVDLGRQPDDSSLLRLSPIPGASASIPGINEALEQKGIFSDFIPRGEVKFGNLQGAAGGGASPSSSSGSGAGQDRWWSSGLRAVNNTLLSQQRSPAIGAGSQSTSSGSSQRQQNQDRAERMTDERDETELPPPEVLTPPKTKPPLPASGDWSGGESAPGQAIVNNGYHTDYIARGKRKIGGDRAWRNNNPGNIKYSSSSPASRNAIGQDYGGFAVFDTMQDGIRAQDTLWRTPMYQNMTLRQAVRSWTSNDPPATQESYLRDLMTQTGAGSDTKVSSLNESQLARLEEGQRRHEGGQKGRIVDIAKPKSAGKHK